MYYLTIEHFIVALVLALAAVIYIMWLGEGETAWPPMARARKVLIHLFHNKKASG